MSRNCLSGVPMGWLLLFLLLLSDLTSAVDNPYLQNDTEVCTGQQAQFRWKYKVKSFEAIVWNHREKKIASSSPSLTFSPEEIISDQFKGRLTFKSTDPFSFTLENATKVDNGMYECVFQFDDGNTDSVRGKLEVKDFDHDATLLKEEEKKDSCVTLSCKVKPPCTWTYPNGTTEVAERIRHCSTESAETIQCESDDHCKFANYTKCSECESHPKRRRRNSSDGTCSCPDDDQDESTDPISHVPVVLGVLAAISAIAVITVIIVFYKRRLRNQGVQGPPGNYDQVPVDGNQHMS